MQTEIENIIKKFFEKLQVHTESLNIKEDEPNIFSVAIKTDDSGILIWPHGKNLEAIQWLLKLMLSKNTDSKIKLHLEINDYMESKDERLFSFIQSKIELVEKTWRDIKLPFYWAYDRKKIHSFVGEHWNNDISTKSEWEWKERRLFICTKAPKQITADSKPNRKSAAKKLTIDIDWEDI